MAWEVWAWEAQAPGAREETWEEVEAWAPLVGVPGTKVVV